MFPLPAVVSRRGVDKVAWPSRPALPSGVDRRPASSPDAGELWKTRPGLIHGCPQLSTELAGLSTWITFTAAMAPARKHVGAAGGSPWRSFRRLFPGSPIGDDAAVGTRRAGARPLPPHGDERLTSPTQEN